MLKIQEDNIEIGPYKGNVPTRKQFLFNFQLESAAVGLTGFRLEFLNKHDNPLSIARVSLAAELLKWKGDACEIVGYGWLRGESAIEGQINMSYAVMGYSRDTLSTPVIILPAEGEVFSNYPRKTTVKWQPVPNADQFLVEVQYLDEPKWVGERKIKNVQGTSITFNFVGAQPGRCRVTAQHSTGKYKPSKPSAWRNFKYTI
jgi:hypothetical protein